MTTRIARAVTLAAAAWALAATLAVAALVLGLTIRRFESGRLLFDR